MREERLRQVLRELSRAFAEAIAARPEAGEQLRLLREEGYSLFLVLDGARAEGEEREADVPAPPARSTPGAPTFRIHGDDLVFLRSLGIDPTRRMRRRPG